MLHLDLHIQPQTANKLKKILASAPDQEAFARSVIAYQVSELQKGILNIRLDLRQFEEKHGQSSEAFYRAYEQGAVGDGEDMMVWAGLVEMLRDNERQLQEIA
jgi:hypothetical protein